MRQLCWALICLLGLLLGSYPAAARITFERIETPEGTKIIILQGEFEFSDEAQALLREVAEFAPSIIGFDSPGGNVDAAMRFGRAIRQLGLPTVQIRSSECASACALAFLGGVARFAEPGSIGVHRSSFSASMKVAADHAVAAIQAQTADIISYIIEMGVDPGLMQLSLSVDSSDMRYLTALEMRQFRVTSDGSSDSSGAARSALPARPLPSSAHPRTPTIASDPPGSAMSEALPQRRRLNRVAYYTGLDFLGSDINSVAVGDVGSCTAACVGHDMCRAFTFNVRTKPERGPNCFLKTDRGQYDGNSAAVSGLLLGPSDADPQTMHFGIIDPGTDLYKDVDAPGFDLSNSPQATATTPRACRIACVNEQQCAAFTFLSKSRQCWLKRGIGQSRALAGAITGAKTAMTYVPQTVVLD